MNRKLFFISLLTIILTFPCDPGYGQTKDPVRKLFSKGEELYKKGEYEHAAQSWEQALNLLRPQISKNPKAVFTYTETVIRLSRAYQAIGHHGKALSAFNEAVPVIEKSSDKHRNALFFSAMGDIYLSLGNMREAYKYMRKGVKEAVLTKNPHVQAAVLNDMGNLLTADENYQEAIDIYDECLALTDSDDNPGPFRDELKSKILINLVFVIAEAGTFQDISKALEDALTHIRNLPDSYDKAADLISVGIITRKIRNNKELVKDDAQAETYLTNAAYKAFSQARQIAEELESTRIISHAYGQLGQLYEDQARYPEAIKLTRSAIFFAEQGKYPEILYAWQWQMGRLMKAEGDIEKAMSAYNSAISTLNPIRREMFAGYRIRKDTFNEKIKPVYLGFAELLLEQASNYEASGTPETTEEKLRQARDIMENLKTAELQDFFQNECVTAIQNKATILNRTAPHTALLYPVSLPDKLVLLLTLPDGMKQVSARVDSELLRETALRFRSRLQTRPNNQFFYDAWQLYDWLIRPVETILTARDIDTLLVVPDGALRLIPFSTLHDRNQYLVEKYAVGTIPGITLTDPKPLDPEKTEILLAGISESVQGFPRLPGVPGELKSIKQIMNGKIVLQDKEYTIANLTHEFKKNPYSIVHLATHGVFSGTQEESFLLAYDGKLTMNLLEKLIDSNRFRDQQVELLTLSACQTAQGDERAALGLAGVALKAGVRGAVATLWYVDDEAAALAIREFYNELRTTGISKAKALQNAQKKLISRRRYRHPGYWGPFLLIGNWL